jgi:hypothetical protein
MSCRSGCPTPGRHESWGECARDAGIQIDRFSLTQHGKEPDKRKDHTLARFRDLARSGVTAKSPLLKDVEAAEKVANSA